MEEDNKKYRLILEKRIDEVKYNIIINIIFRLKIFYKRKII